ncbi:hypothetical protein OG819_26985 [Streptomyces sp. NBC_01549]|uniref:hypothetical protein n=1 Tax=Streptomyces sp. NBC_01549 TaxID=2975874 RepID=UPI00224EE194|nr:hypothetical protein [Streptomyces sp. NBC_01549]MCX4593266.1 hypothetical protein [Streptomyces sp. NBC_01549]
MNALLASELMPGGEAFGFEAPLEDGLVQPATAQAVREDAADRLQAELASDLRPLWDTIYTIVLHGYATDHAARVDDTMGMSQDEWYQMHYRWAQQPEAAAELDAYRQTLVDQLRTSGSWANTAGDAAPILLARIFRLNIEVIQPNGAVVLLNPVNSDRRVVLLRTGHDGHHWMGTRWPGAQ